MLSNTKGKRETFFHELMKRFSSIPGSYLLAETREIRRFSGRGTGLQTPGLQTTLPAPLSGVSA